MRENPYRLAFDVWGIGFLSADKLAAALGIAPRCADARIEAGVRHVLDEEAGNGHVFVPRERLVRRRRPRCSGQPEDAGRRGDRPAGARRRGGHRRHRSSTTPDPAVYETRLYRAETALAAGLRRLLAAPAPAAGASTCRRALAWYEREAGIALARQQAEAVQAALTEQGRGHHRRPGRRQDHHRARHRVHPDAQKGLRVALAAPTGRAAKRLSDATGAPASTLHRLLEWRPAEGTLRRATPRARSRPTC